MASEKVAAGIAKVTLEAAGRLVGIEGGGGLTRLLSEPSSSGRDVVVPHDLHLAKLPPLAEDGTAECWRCKQRLPFAQLDIAGQAYQCRPCMLRANQVATGHVDVDVKIGRGRWWLLPSIFVTAGTAAIAIIIAYA
jgi:hypothetical protein